MYIFVIEDHILDRHSCQICYPRDMVIIIIIIILIIIHIIILDKTACLLNPVAFSNWAK